MDIAKKLKLLRNIHRLTLTELARLINISRTSLSAYELDLYQPTVDNLVILARFYKVSTDFLLSYEVGKEWEDLISEEKSNEKKKRLIKRRKE